MKTSRGLPGDERDPTTEHEKRGSYPPDIARRRRALGLPVTPADFAAAERGEYRAPPVTTAQMIATLRAVAPHAAPTLRAVWLELAEKLEARTPITADEAKRAGPLGHAILRVQAREPGEEG